MAVDRALLEHDRRALRQYEENLHAYRSQKLQDPPATLNAKLATENVRLRRMLAEKERQSMVGQSAEDLPAEEVGSDD